MVPSPTTSKLFRGGTLLCLASVLLLGGWLRLTGLDWDERQHLHPDERYLTMVVTAERWPASLKEYFDEARSPLNPRNVGFRYFAYGTLPATLVKAASLVSGRSGYDDVPIVGRATSAALDLGTIVLLFLFARRVHRCDGVALLAAFLLAVAVLPIQHAHFFVVDPFVVFFTMAALLAVAAIGPGAYWPYVATGLFFALALASKMSVLPFVAIVVAAAVRAEGAPNVRRWAVRVGVAAVSALLVFRIVEPSAFATGWPWFALSPRWLGDLLYTRRLVSGAIDAPPGVQWVDRAPFLFQLDNLVRWNLGPALGAAACAATAAAAWQLAVRRRTIHLIPVLWIALVFGPHIGQFVKAGRYLLPIYPMLTLLAAWGLTQLWTKARGAWAWRAVAGLVVAIVCLGTLTWAIAFTSIYRRPNSRVTASRWIYAHIPSGALTWEVWDDRIPLRIDAGTPERYTDIAMSNYDNDSPDKLATLLRQVDRADYIVLSSNRLYDSIPRLPMRYPVTSRYYAALFDGRLGFERIAEFTSYPRIGALEFPDQSAEEAFSVYDHARVQIFRRTSRWNPAAAERLLTEGVDWNAVVPVSAVNAGLLGNGSAIAPAEWERIRERSPARPAADAGRSDARAVLLWCLALQMVGFAALPITASVFRGSRDRGWLLSKTVGLLIVSYLGWLGASLGAWTFARTTIALTSACLLVWTFWWTRRGSARRGPLDWRLVCAEESLFWAAFALFLIVRAGNPDLWHPNFGGEKPMDFAYLNAVVRSGTFPPYDPWFAGSYINYYYFGFVLIGALVALTGLPPALAYNLAVPTVGALAFGAAFAVARSLVAAVAGSESRSRWAFAGGVFGAVGVTVLGNLGELALLASSWRVPEAARWPSWVWYWNATRIIPHPANEAPPITEFPFFSLLYGDLHAHLIALPLTLLALGIATTFVLPARDGVAPSSRVSSLALLGLVLGALYATNTWDYPTYVLVAAAALALDERRGGRSLLAFSMRLGAVVGLSRLFFAPFLAHFTRAYGSVEPWLGSSTSLGAYLLIHGVFLFALSSFWCYRRLGRPSNASAWNPPALELLGVISAVGLLLTVAVEWIVLGGDIGRMNTVFKLYFQVWVLWAVAASAGTALLASDFRTFTTVDRGVGPRLATAAWAAGLLFLTGAAALYVPVATWARWQDRFDPRTGFTLDGQAYMKTARHAENGVSFPLAADLEAIRWLEREVDGTPVIAEGHTPEYRWGGRISANTGLPTILGWRWHETQQRAALPPVVVERRAADVSALYSDGDLGRAQTILDRYHVGYVVVGDLERILYPAAGIEKFEQHPDRFVPAYRNARLTIYRVVPRP